LENAPKPNTTLVSLTLSLRWQVGTAWYELETVCGPGLFAVDGPAASALLRVLAGHAVPSVGTACLDNVSLLHGEANLHHIGAARPVATVLEGQSLPLWRSARGLASGAIRAQGVRRRAANERADQVLRRLHADAWARRPLRNLGKQEQWLAQLGAALAIIPGLLLLERVDAALSSPHRDMLFATLWQVTDESETVVLLVPDSPIALTRTLSPQLVGATA